MTQCNDVERPHHMLVEYLFVMFIKEKHHIWFFILLQSLSMIMMKCSSQ